jgi:cysteine desulfurase
VPITPLIDGGGHERGLRSGTLPVPLIVGFGEAVRIAAAELDFEAARLRELRERLWHALRQRLDGLTLNGHSERRLPANLNVSFDGVDGEALMVGVAQRRLAVSSGSACTTADPEPSHVLRAMGVSDRLSRASLRFGLGRFNTVEDVDRAVEIVYEVVTELRRR